MRGSAVAALAIDLLAGEPPIAVHPTVAMGRWIGHARASRRSELPRDSFADGVRAVLVGAASSAAGAAIVDASLARVRRGPRIVARGAALKPALSLRALVAAAGEVQRALEAGHLTRARRLLSTHLVSRDTRALTASHVAAAAIESVAENFNDSVVGPLMAFRVGGLAAAYAFRFVNTADAMLGYHTPELEWFGKFAARLDDGLAYVPARVSAVLIAVAASLTGDSSGGALRAILSDADRTESPNAGWPMSAMAGALGVRLEKVGHYLLNRRGRSPGARDIARARRIVLVASGLAAIATDLS